MSFEPQARKVIAETNSRGCLMFLVDKKRRVTITAIMADEDIPAILQALEMIVKDLRKVNSKFLITGKDGGEIKL